VYSPATIKPLSAHLWNKHEELKYAEKIALSAMPVDLKRTEFRKNSNRVLYTAYKEQLASFKYFQSNSLRIWRIR
jgi:hypothetical protein